MDLAPPPSSWPNSRRRRSFIASAVSLSLEAAILVAGVSGVHLHTCGGISPVFWPMLALTLTALAFGLVGAVSGFRSMRDSGGASRTLAPLLGIAASALGALVLHDVFTGPVLNCIK